MKKYGHKLYISNLIKQKNRVSCRICINEYSRKWKIKVGYGGVRKWL